MCILIFTFFQVNGEKTNKESIEQQENVTILLPVINNDVMTTDQYDNATIIESETEPETSEDG